MHDFSQPLSPKDNFHVAGSSMEIVGKKRQKMKLCDVILIHFCHLNLQGVTKNPKEHVSVVQELGLSKKPDNFTCLTS